MRRLLWISIVFAAILTVSCNKEDENSGQMSLTFPQVTGSIPRVFLFSDDPEKQFIEVDGITDPEKLEVIIDSEEPAFEIESINEKGIRIKPLGEPSFKIKATKIHIIEPGRSTKDNPSATLYVYLTATPASMEVYLNGNSRIAISDKRNGERYVFASNLEDVEKRIHLSENQSVRVYFQLVDKNGNKSQKMVLSEEVFVFEGEIIPSGNSALSDNLVCDHEVLTAAENVEKMSSGKVEWTFAGKPELKASLDIVVHPAPKAIHVTNSKGTELEDNKNYNLTDGKDRFMIRMDPIDAYPVCQWIQYDENTGNTVDSFGTQYGAVMDVSAPKNKLTYFYISALGGKLARKIHVRYYEK